MKGVILLFGALGFAHAAAGQVAVTYFPVQSVLAIDTDTERRGWAGLSLETNTFISNVNVELHGAVNIKRGELVNYYAGLGINANPFYALNELPLVNGYALTVGARIKPLARHRHAQLVFELSPYANRFLDGGLLRTRLGVAYNFHRSE